MEGTRSAGVHGRVRAAVLVACTVASLGLAGFVLFWVTTGGRWFIVETPSMGTAAPVGTLLWVKPTPFSRLHPGQIITFHAPHTDAIYTHRVVAVHPNGTLTTKGDLNATPDPWRLRARDVVGTVEMRWWGLGWVIKAAPILLIGGSALAVLVARFTNRRWKVPAATVGIAVLLSVAIFVTRPLTRGDLLGFDHAPGGARATYVSTGLLPVQLRAVNGGAHVNLLDGQVGSVLVRHPNAHDTYVARLEPHLTWWIWGTLMGACFAPALWSLLFGVRREDDAKRNHPAARRRLLHRPRVHHT